jgi:hypothetical protein
MFRSIVQVDLVCADAEAANDYQIFSLLQNLSCEFRFRANADDVNITRVEKP